MSEFDSFVQQLMAEASQSVEEAPDTEATDNYDPDGQEKTADYGSDVSEAILDAEDNLPEDLKKQADALALMEAFNISKQANFIQDKVKEALGVNFNKTASVDDVAEQLYADAYEEALVNSEADDLYAAAYKEATGDPGDEDDEEEYDPDAEEDAQALYAAAYEEAQGTKTASDTAQFFVNGLVRENYDISMAEYAQGFKHSILSGQ